MNALVVKEDIRSKRRQNLAFFNAAEEKDLVNAHVPCAQGADHSFMRGSISCGYESGTDRNGILGELLLYDGKGLQ